MLRSVQTVTLLGIAVQLAGILRIMLIAAALGASLAVDAYNLALVIATLITTVIGGWLQVSFVGRYAGLIATDQLEIAAVYRSRMLLLVSGTAMTCMATAYAFPDLLIGLLLSDANSETAAAAAEALRVIGLILGPVIIGDFIGLVLNSHRQFFAAAFAPLLNAAVSVVVLWLWPGAGLSALTWSLVAGAFAQFLVVALTLASRRLGFMFSAPHAAGEIWTTIRIGLPVLPAILMANLAAAILQFRSAELGEGAVAILGYAFRLHNALTQIIVIGLGTVLLPHFAALWARGEHARIVALFRRLIRVGLLICIYLAGGIVLMSSSFVSILLERGAFDADTAIKVGGIWGILSFSLFPIALGTFIAKLAQAKRSSGAILVSGMISFTVTWTVALVGAKVQSLSVIASAAMFSAAAVTAFWIFWLSVLLEARDLVTDMTGAAARCAMVLAPAIAFDFLLVEMMPEVPALASLLLRGTVYTVIIAGALTAAGLHSWFLQPDLPPYSNQNSNESER